MEPNIRRPLVSNVGLSKFGPPKPISIYGLSLSVSLHADYTASSGAFLRMRIEVSCV